MTPLTTIRMMLVSDNLAGVLEILILQDKHNIRTLSLNIKINLYSLRNKHEKLAILPVSKARTNKFYIYRQCTYIVYILVMNLMVSVDLFNIMSG